MPERPPHSGPHDLGPSSPTPTAPADPGARPAEAAEPGQQPGPDGDQSRYRSLRDLSHGGRPGPSRAPATQTWQSQRNASRAEPATAPHAPSSGAVGQPEVWAEPTTPAPAAPRRGQRLLLAVTSLAVVLALATGGYVAYRAFAPQFGLAYAPGGTAAINGVAFTVLRAECGLTSAPETDARPAKSQFCLVDLNAENKTDSNRHLVLSLFNVNLDSGLQADPAGSAMQTLSVKLEPGESRDLQLVYDVWDGVRMSEVQVQIGYETELIALV